MSAGGGCEAPLNAGAGCWWVAFRECGELLNGRIFPLRLKWTVYINDVGPAILYGSESLCLMGSEMNFTKDRKIHSESNVWSTAERQKTIYRFDVDVGFE